MIMVPLAILDDEEELLVNLHFSGNFFPLFKHSSMTFVYTMKSDEITRVYT